MNHIVSIQQHWMRVLAIATLMCCALLTVSASVSTPAIAAESVSICNPTATHGCVNGILQDESQRALSDVTVTLSGVESATTTTDATGKWAFSVTKDGSYTVSIDPSVASSHHLKANKATVNIKKGDFSKSRQVVRFDEAQSSDASSSSSSASSSSSSSSSSSHDQTSSAASADNDTAWADFSERLWNQLFSGIVFGLLLGLMSMGMNLVYGTTKLSSFSHGEQVTLGGLMAYVGTQLLHWPLLVSALFAVVIGAITGWIQNDLIWSPLRKKHVGAMQQMIVTIGLSMTLQYLFQFFFGADVKGITVAVAQGYQIGPITTDTPTLLAAAVAIIVIISVTFFLYRTRLGRATRAIADNSALAAASGINVEEVVRVVWILSTALAALSGVLIGIYFNGISWNTGALLLLLMFSAVTLGGLGTANGALIGSLVIGIVADMSSLFIPNDMRYASALAILIIVLLIRPQGIFGKLQRIG